MIHFWLNPAGQWPENSRVKGGPATSWTCRSARYLCLGVVDLAKGLLHETEHLVHRHRRSDKSNVRLPPFCSSSTFPSALFSTTTTMDRNDRQISLVVIRPAHLCETSLDTLAPGFSVVDSHIGLTRKNPAPYGLPTPGSTCWQSIPSRPVSRGRGLVDGLNGTT